MSGSHEILIFINYAKPVKEKSNKHHILYKVDQNKNIFEVNSYPLKAIVKVNERE